MKKLYALLAGVLFLAWTANPTWAIDFNHQTGEISAFGSTGTFTSEALVDAGTDEVFDSADTTPNVSTGILWTSNSTGVTITDFDGTPLDGQLLIVRSGGATVYDCTGAGLDCGSVDITTAAGDMTHWVYDGTDWDLIAFMDVSTDMGTDGSGGFILTGGQGNHSINADEYFPVSGSDSSSATEGDRQQVIGAAMTCTFMSVYVVTAPGASNQWDITLRDDGSSTSLTCTIANTATTCTATVSVAIAAGSKVSTFWDETGTVTANAGEGVSYTCSLD